MFLDPEVVAFCKIEQLKELCSTFNVGLKSFFIDAVRFAFFSTGQSILNFSRLQNLLVLKLSFQKKKKKILNGSLKQIGKTDAKDLIMTRTKPLIMRA